MNIIIHGPQGCGKTTNAERLSQFFNCTTVCDEPGMARIGGVSENILILTNRESIPCGWLKDARVIEFSVAMRALGAVHVKSS